MIIGDPDFRPITSGVECPDRALHFGCFAILLIFPIFHILLNMFMFVSKYLER